MLQMPLFKGFTGFLVLSGFV